MVPPVETNTATRIRSPEKAAGQPRRRIEVAAAVASPPKDTVTLGSEATPGSNLEMAPVNAPTPAPRDVLTILNYLESAKRIIENKVKAVIDKNEKEMAAAEKTALKQKLEKIKVLLSQAKRAIEALQGDPASAGKVAALLNEAQAIAASVGKLASPDAASFAADLTALDAQVKAFGEKAAKLLPGEKVDPLVEAKVGLTRKQAERIWAFILNGKIDSKGEIASADVKATARAIAAAWIKGDLTLDQLNNILEKHGIKLGKDLASFLIKGEGAGVFGSVELGGEENFLRFSKNLFLTLQFWIEKDINLNDLDQFEDADADTHKYLMQMAGAMNKQLKLYGEKSNFFVINFDKQGRNIANALGLKGNGPADWWKALGKNTNANLTALFEKIDPEDKLTDQQKWDRLVLEIMRQLFEQTNYAKDDDQFRNEKNHVEAFKRLLEGVQKADDGSVVARNYRAALQDLILNGSPVDPKRVLGDALITAPKVEARKEAVPGPIK